MEHVDKILAYIREVSEAAAETDITADTDYFETGIIDSLNFVGLVLYAEELTGFDYSEHMETPENLNTVNNLLNPRIAA